VLLRPADWLEWEEAGVGEDVDLDLEELGASGPARVLSIEPCPPIQPGDGGRVVTGTFAHASANVVDLYVEGLSEPVGVTANHLFWSADREDFVAAGLLRVGERLSGFDGEPRVAKVAPRSGAERVYNLEVEGEHAYYVGERGLLVHNSYSQVLRNAMNNAGVFGKAGEAAHHIVPHGAFGRSIRMRFQLWRAQRVLTKNGVNIHSATNGVFLRPSLHKNLHTVAYVKQVADRLVRADKVGAFAVKRELRKIAADILTGVITGAG